MTIGFSVNWTMPDLAVPGCCSSLALMSQQWLLCMNVAVVKGPMLTEYLAEQVAFLLVYPAFAVAAIAQRRYRHTPRERSCWHDRDRRFPPLGG